MNPENRTERAIFEPAHKQLPIRGIIRVAGDESANVRRPIREARKRVVQTRGNLAPQSQKIRVDIARPGHNRISLAAGKRRTREDEDTLLTRSAPLAVVNSSGSH